MRSQRILSANQRSKTMRNDFEKDRFSIFLLLLFFFAGIRRRKKKIKTVQKVDFFFLLCRPQPQYLLNEIILKTNKQTKMVLILPISQRQIFQYH